MTEEQEESRVTALGTLRYAVEYYAAAKVATERLGDCIPAQFLIGHAIELALKAYLLHQGKTEQFARRELGHNLTACLVCAEEATLGDHLSLSDEERRRLLVFNELYCFKQFEYIETGYKIFVPIDQLQCFARRLLLATVALIPMADGLLTREPGRTLLTD